MDQQHLELLLTEGQRQELRTLRERAQARQLQVRLSTDLRHVVTCGQDGRELFQETLEDALGDNANERQDAASS